MKFARHIFGPLVGLCLSLALVLTGHAMQSARSAKAAAMQVELCTGLTLATVYLDQEGNPTQAPHFCPDCTLVMLEAATPPFVLAPRLAVFAHAPLRAIRASTPQAPAAYLSRAPPVLV